MTPEEVCVYAGRFLTRPPKLFTMEVTLKTTVKEWTLGKRLGVEWLPAWCGSWRAYCGSGHRFVQLGRVRFWIRWAYD